MTRGVQTILGVALAATIVACGNDRANDADKPVAKPETGAAVGTAGNVDRSFVEDQLEDGQAEVALGTLAAERASNPEVKQFAQRMVRDHQMAGEELRRAVAAVNETVNPPVEFDGDHKSKQEELMRLSGLDFDRKYIDVMVEEHEEAVNELEKQVDAANPQIRQWAAKTLPTVREHLEHAKQLDKALEQQK